MLGEHGEWCKIANTELSTRVPLIVVIPGQPSPGTTRSELVGLVDVYPTLVATAGFTPASTLQGNSLVPLVMQPKDQALADAPPAAPFNVSFSQIQHGLMMGLSMRTHNYRCAPPPCVCMRA
jgi:arylsulfatase A-like enzyme